jgi:hypothetical protein
MSPEAANGMVLLRRRISTATLPYTKASDTLSLLDSSQFGLQRGDYMASR